ncbi:MAG: tetratricopeptide repeat protein [Gammaproteobacteria bacterium]|nr:tetratricopeptide repeat protein [Gammaproteobacteria bacterium]
MLKRITLPLGALLLIACALPALAADPSSDQIYQTLRSGNVAGAQQMIAQVLRDHPQSGKAHYVAAEIDARAGNYGLARQELATAESLEPGLPFANPRAVRDLKLQLGGASGAGFAPQPVRVRRSSHVGLFLILIGAAVVLWLMLRRRATAMGYRGQYPGGIAPGMPPGGYGPTGYGPGGYPGGYMPGGGSGIMGSVASGLALGAGVAAGEELVQHMMGGGSSNPGGGGFVPSAQADQMPDPNADMGGNDFGLNDPGSWDDGGGGGGGWDDGGGGGDGGGWT